LEKFLLGQNEEEFGRSEMKRLILIIALFGFITQGAETENNVRQACAAKALEHSSQSQKEFLADLCGYYLGAALKDLSKVNLAENITYHGPIAGGLNGREAFEKGAYDLFNVLTHITIKRIIINLNHAVVVTELRIGTKILNFAEVWTRGEKSLVRLENYFDPRSLLENKEIK
jgi:hypothetical protein